MTKKTLAIASRWPYSPLAQFRTCLWSCVGWWASGQEAGQPPGSISLLDGSDNQSAAGGETGVPRSPRGTRLKATTERAFLVSLCPPKAWNPKRLVHLCQACGGNSFQSTAATAARPSKPRVSNASGWRCNSRGFCNLKPFMASQWGSSCHDRTYP